jgi:hypothetical protein
MFFFIWPDDFDHPFDVKDAEHRLYNAAAARYLPKAYPGCSWADRRALYIDLPKIAEMQLLEHGIPSKNINPGHMDAYARKGLPTTRTGNGKGRFLAMIVRHKDR